MRRSLLTVGRSLAVAAASLTALLPAAVAASPARAPSTASIGMSRAGMDPPVVSLSAANAPTGIVAPVTYTAQGRPDVVSVTGAHVSRSADPMSDHADSITPTGTSKAFQSYSETIKTDASTLEMGLRAVGGHYRVWVNGSPLTLAAVPAPNTGSFYRIILTFPAVAMRSVRLQTDESRFTNFTLPAGAQVAPAEPTGARVVVLGDSFAEGTGARTRFDTWAQTFCALSGWSDCWASGSGGTGYLKEMPALRRTAYQGRVFNDVIKWNPDVVVVSGGRNDGGRSPALEQAAVSTLVTTLRSALPRAVIIVTSVFPATAAEAHSPGIVALSNAIDAGSAAGRDYFLDVMGANSYITGGGNSGAPTGQGNSDAYTGPDGVHPTAAGHDALGQQLFTRFATLTAARQAG